MSNPKPGRITGGSGRGGARRRVGTGRGGGRTGRRPVGSPRRRPTLLLARASRTKYCPQCPLGSTNKRNHIETARGTRRAVDDRLLTGLSAVRLQHDGRTSSLAADQCTDIYVFVSVNPFHASHVRETYLRFIRGTTAALRSWLLTSGSTPTCLCKPLSCEACPGERSPIRRLPHPDMRTTGGSRQGNARRNGGAGRGRAGRDANGSVRPGDDRPSCRPQHRRELF